MDKFGDQWVNNFTSKFVTSAKTPAIVFTEQGFNNCTYKFVEQKFMKQIVSFYMGFNFALCMTQKKFRAAGIFGKNFPFVGDLLAINSV